MHRYVAQITAILGTEQKRQLAEDLAGVLQIIDFIDNKFLVFETSKEIGLVSQKLDEWFEDNTYS